MDIGTISLVVVFGLIILLAIGMPLGFASAFLALVVLVLKFEPSVILQPMTFGEGMLTSRPGTGALYILAQKIFDLMTEYVLLSVPLFIFMAALLERSGIAKGMYDALDYWLSSVRGGIAVVTSLMAVIMAAMSGIIGGEVVLLGLIALPQMLRLGYNQNLAIGTICASGSLGTMIPPSIVLIIYGLITETSIKNLFTGAFIPGFMLASFIIIYILIRVNLDPSQAPLPERDPAEDDTPDPSPLARIVLLAIAAAPLLLAIYGLVSGTGGFGALVIGLMFGAAVGSMASSGKGQMFASFLAIMGAAGATVLFLRAGFFFVTGQYILEDGEDPISLGMPYHMPWIAAWLVGFLALIFAVFGTARSSLGWKNGKGLVAPFTIIGVVLGSIYGGITGITEAAGMGALAVFIISVLMDRDWEEWKALVRANLPKIGITLAAAIAIGIALAAYFGGNMSYFISMPILLVFIYWCMNAPGKVDLVWDGMLRTLRSTGTIIWVTIGAAALAGAYTLAGGPNYIANLIVGSDMPTMLVLLTMMLILLFMGAFMDWVGIVLLIIPVFLPIVQRLPIEEIGIIGELQPKYLSVWFGVLFCMNMQVSFLSPPFGPAAFYLKSVAPAHISLTDIFKGFLPFICIQLLALSVMLVWPPIIEILLP